MKTQATYYVERGTLKIKQIAGRDLSLEQAKALQAQVGGRIHRHKGPEQPGYAHERNTGGGLVGKQWF